MKLYSGTEQDVRLLDLTDSEGALVDTATVTFTLLDRKGVALPQFNGLVMASDGVGTGDYSYTIPADAPLTPGLFGCQAVFKVTLGGVLRMTKYRPVAIEKGSDTCGCDNGSNNGGCQ